MRGLLALTLLAAGLALPAAPADAVGPPLVTATWVSDVTATSARLHATVNPEGSSTSYRFEYLTEANWLADGEGFAGAARAPASGEGALGSAETDQPVVQHIEGLAPATAYRYRIVATSHCEPAQPGNTCSAAGPASFFATQAPAGAGAEECANAGLRLEDGSTALPDCRAYELVSPVDKNGGGVAAPGALWKGGVLQAAADGEAATFGSSASFGEGAVGAPLASQYLSRRTESGWLTGDITPPTLSGSYAGGSAGVPYQLFSPDLARAVMLDGRRCAEGEECPRSYSMRDGNGALIADSPAQPGLNFAGAAPDLGHVVFTSPAGLYVWTGGGLEAISEAPGARLGAQAGAVSADGARVYFTAGGNLYLREGATTRQVDGEVGGGGEFETASADGSVAFFAKGGHLYRYEAQFEDLRTTDLTPEGELEGVLGASADGSSVYYQTAAGLYLWQSPATTVQVAHGPAAAQPTDYPPTIGTARVNPDGSRLAFLSRKPLTGHDNTDQTSGEPDPEVFVYDAETGELVCASCNPTGERPQGPSTIPGAIANGSGESATDSYKPRVLSRNGHRLFFESEDRIAPADSSAAPDVYEWEAPGEGSCRRGEPDFSAPSDGGVSVVSSGTSGEPSLFIDASEAGGDAFLLTGASLLPSDPGSTDLYDAREGGGFPEARQPEACNGDECAPVPSPPLDPSPGTLVAGPPNPAPHFLPAKCRKGTVAVRRHGRRVCVVRKHRRHRSQRGDR